jgi:serine protease
VTDNDGATDAVTKTVTVSTPSGNAAPTAAFTHSCTGLTCNFSDRSTDSDGIIAARRWTFGNGSTGTGRNPTRTYASAGTYTVTLRVTDDDGATNETSTAVTVSASTTIVLSATGRFDATRQYMTLTWTGARGDLVDIYRNGSRLKTTANDGKDTNGRNFVGPATYVFKVCEAGTSVCSNEATVRF